MAPSVRRREESGSGLETRGAPTCAGGDVLGTTNLLASLRLLCDSLLFNGELFRKQADIISSPAVLLPLPHK